MSTILLVEDNPHIMNINSQMLALKGYEVLKAVTAKECLERLEWHPVDLIVLDILLPDGDGLSLCRKIKEHWHVPILFLSALGENSDIVKGLQAGGDDYLAKPYDLNVLAARVEARLRGRQETGRWVDFGKLRLDTFGQYGYYDGQDLLLTKQEFQVLLMLARAGERQVGQDELLREVWNMEGSDPKTTLWPVVSRLKAKLRSAGADLEIAHERGGGYNLARF